MAVKIDTSKIEAELKKRINTVLQTDAVKIIKETEKKHVQSDVYGAYGPLHYGRRGEGGGLASEGSMTVHAGDMEVAVINEASFNNAYEFGRGFIPPPNYGNTLAELIEGGNGAGGHYNYPYESGSGSFLGARPFVANTREELRSSGVLRDAIKSGLSGSGLNVV